MRPLLKGIIIALIHVCIVSSLGAKLLYDRAARPRVWAQAAPFDPDLPIRGRYVSLQLVVEPRGIQKTAPGPGWVPPQSAVLKIENGRLVAEAVQKNAGYNPESTHVRFVQRQDRQLAVLEQPVAFFIPERVPDPSQRLADEELWVEVTIPRKGSPRPIRLGVKKTDGPIVPLELR